MAEPTRKREKKSPTASKSPIREPEQKTLILTSSHPTSPGQLDLEEFVTGRTTSNGSGQNGRWLGPFAGRQQLTEELAPHIFLIHSTSPSATLATCVKALRKWWRLLDEYHGIAPVSTVLDINDVHGAIQMRAGVSGDITNEFLRFVNAWRREQKLPPLYWPKNGRSKNVSDLMSIDEVKRLYHPLKHQVFNVLHRWETADSLAVASTDWTHLNKSRPDNLAWCIGDVHASYRGLAAKLCHPCPSQQDCKKALNVASTGLTRGIFRAVLGLYPSRSDIQSMFLLFVLRTGWNAATALNIDCADEKLCVRPHPSSPLHHIVTSIKGRGNTVQTAIGLDRSELSPGNIIRVLYERTLPLRNELKAQLQELIERGQNTENFLRIAELRRQIRSPWIYVKYRAHNEIDALETVSYCVDAYRKSIVRHLIKNANEAEPSKPPISTEFTLTDLRDAYISFAYQASGYSWLVAKLASGHANVESLKSYLHNRRWKAHGEGKVRQFLHILWVEIRERRCVDAAVLFAMVERGEISEEQRIRWENHKDRTRVGTGCISFYKPPVEIAPNHVEGTGCRIQRCILCPYAVIFEDSLDHLCRRLAELYNIKTTVPLPTWLQSNFADELEAAEATLNQTFTSDKVLERLQFWTDEIAAGRHRPLTMDGEYGA